MSRIWPDAAKLATQHETHALKDRAFWCMLVPPTAAGCRRKDECTTTTASVRFPRMNYSNTEEHATDIVIAKAAWQRDQSELSSSEIMGTS